MIEMENSSRWSRLAGLAVLALCSPASHAAQELEAITFAVEPGKVYVPLEEARKALGWRVRANSKQGQIQLQSTTYSQSSLRKLLDGTELIGISDLEAAGARVTREPAGKTFKIAAAWRYFTLKVGAKRAEVSLAAQRLRCWQGDRLVLESRVSSGRRGSTPSGNFRAGPYKARRHYSSRYHNAPMPWSVQVTGHVFIHGFTSVPDYPASHGCIRLPLNEGNPARFFYEWIDKGTPIKVVKK